MKIGYYCEVCNVMIPTLAKVGIHVKNMEHIKNKNERLLKVFEDGSIIVFDDIVLESNNWHGLSDGSCLICEIDYVNDNEHKNDAFHILNLIQSKLELNEHGFVFRKIDENSYNCLICNTIITKKSKDKHCSSSEHNAHYIKCQQNKKIYEADKNSNKTKTGESVTALADGCTNLDKIDNSKKFLEETKNKSESSTVNTVGLVTDTLDKAQVDGGDVDKLLSPYESLEKAKIFAKENNLKYKRNGTYCKHCDVRISSTLKRMREHVAESSHQAKAHNKINKKMTKILLDTYLNSVMTVQNLFHRDIIINDDICISILSFLTISIHFGRIRCQACATNLSSHEIEQHKNTTKHRKLMTNIHVITDFENEFVREIRKHVYHCGYCNFVEVSLDQLKNHLKSVNHYERKADAQRRLEAYSRNTQEENRNELHWAHIMSMFNN